MTDIVETLPPRPPGDVLRADRLGPTQLSATAVADACGVPHARADQILKEETGVTGDTALRPAAFFGTTPVLSMNLQTDYTIERATRQLGAKIERIKPYAPA